MILNNLSEIFTILRIFTKFLELSRGFMNIRIFEDFSPFRNFHDLSRFFTKFHKLPLNLMNSLKNQSIHFSVLWTVINFRHEISWIITIFQDFSWNFRNSVKIDKFTKKILHFMNLNELWFWSKFCRESLLKVTFLRSSWVTFQNRF